MIRLKKKLKNHGKNVTCIIMTIYLKWSLCRSRKFHLTFFVDGVLQRQRSDWSQSWNVSWTTIILHILFIQLSSSCWKKKSFKFPKTFEWSDLMKKAFKKVSDIHEIVKNIIESQQDFWVTQFNSSSFQQWCVGFQEPYSKVNYYFYNTSLSSMVCDNFSCILNTLADVPNADVKIKVHWNLMNKK